MQERYLGDSHDFLKYSLLRYLNAKLGLRLGVNWYLTDKAHVDRLGNNDGEQRHHLKGGIWREVDPELFDKIHAFDEPSNRRLANVAGWGILPSGTQFFDELLSGSDRQDWHARSLVALAKSDLVFLDPDNGFEVRSMTKRTAPKYALYAEAAGHYRAGKTIVGIQFARQCDPIQRGYEVRERLMEWCGSQTALPILRGRLAPNLLFVTIAPDGKGVPLSNAIKAFARQFAKAEIID